MNPSRVKAGQLPLFTQHNLRYFREAGMTIAPMVLDWDEPSPEVKDAFQQFAPDGYGTIVWDLHGTGGKPPRPQVWKNMPIVELINGACNPASPEQAAGSMSQCIKDRGDRQPGFYLFRIVWTNPAIIVATLDTLRKQRPDLDLQVLDPHTFFAAFRQFNGNQ
jgi:hypothetical protein